MEILHQIIGNLVRMYNLQETYVNDAEPWMGILASTAFVVRSMYHSTKQKIPVQLVFGQEVILPINHVADWGYIHYHKQTQIDKNILLENNTRIDHNYRVGYQVMMGSKSAFKYKTPFKGMYEIFQTCTNSPVTL